MSLDVLDDEKMKLTAQASHKADTILRNSDGSTSINDDYKPMKHIQMTYCC